MYQLYFLPAQQYSIYEYTTICLSIYLLMDIWIGVAMNKAALKIHVQIILWVNFFVSFG